MKRSAISACAVGPLTVFSLDAQNKPLVSVVTFSAEGIGKAEVTPKTLRLSLASHLVRARDAAGLYYPSSRP